MSSNASAVLSINCQSNQQSKRLQIYLNEDTRPYFPEDVPQEEVEWVAFFEFLDNPHGIKEVDEKTLFVEFYPDETDFRDEAKELIKTLLEMVGVESIIYCDLGENWTTFEYYTKESRQLLWEVDGYDDEEDDKKCNSFLSKEEKKSYHTLLYGEDYEKQDVEAIMLKLSQKLSIK